MNEILILAASFAALGAFYNSTRIIKNQEKLNEKLNDIKDFLKIEN